ncbi:MAG: thioredoxin-like domain-containing protein [Verrucomicrobiota bacterium]
MIFKSLFIIPLLCLSLVAQDAKTTPTSPSPILNELKGSLVQWDGKNLKKFDDLALASTQYFVFYYSAHWCPPCRAFTPKFVDFYNKQKPLHPQFEVVFVSSDRSEADMKEYMSITKMPWTALQFSQIESKKKITDYAGPGIPCVVVVDRSGKVVANSFKGDEYVGPQKPLDDLLKLLK